MTVRYFWASPVPSHEGEMLAHKGGRYKNRKIIFYGLQIVFLFVYLLL
jgi:hypothetical protein